MGEFACDICHAEYPDSELEAHRHAGGRMESPEYYVRLINALFARHFDKQEHDQELAGVIHMIQIEARFDALGKLDKA